MLGTMKRNLLCGPRHIANMSRAFFHVLEGVRVMNNKAVGAEH